MCQPGSWLLRYWDLTSLLLLSAWVAASVKGIHRLFRSSLWFLGPLMGQETLTSVPVVLRGSTSVINCEVNSNHCYHCQFQPGFLTGRKNLLAQWLPEGVYNTWRSSTGCVLSRNTWGVLYSKMLWHAVRCIIGSREPRPCHQCQKGWHGAEDVEYLSQVQREKPRAEGRQLSAPERGGGCQIKQPTGTDSLFTMCRASS